MKLTGISEKVFIDRYALRDKKGNLIENSPEEMWRRVAKAGASAEPTKELKKKMEKEFYQAMKDWKYMPAGRVLTGAGSGYNVTYYNCFVIPSPKDSRGGIMETLTTMTEILSRGGGVGFNLSSLRPKGARVRKVNGTSSGPMNWAELFSMASHDIIQQGGSRRGALMIMMHDWHPDIEEFITVKQDLKRIVGANLSVCVSDKFMDAVKKDLDWPLIFPDMDDPDYDEKWNGDMKVWQEDLGKKVIVHKVLKARYIWDLIAEAAWRSAEPGVVFMERYNKMYNNYYWARINCTNPCGEEGLPDWGVCNLGSINLSTLVKAKNLDQKGKFDFEQLKKLVRLAVRFQDNLIELDPYFFPGIRETQYNGERRIGVGTLGLGDALIRLHIRYGSPEALEFIEKVYKLIRDEAYRTSSELSKEKGAFGKFDAEKYGKGLFIQQLPKDLQKTIAKNGIRNSLLLMQQPTGTISLLPNVSSGIEPVYEFEFRRRDRIGEHVIRVPIYEEWYQLHKDEVDSGKLKRPAHFVTSSELTPEEHIRTQAAIQKYVDASISKTCNAPNSHTVEDVKKLYNMAYELGCKGVTYFRDGSRAGVLEKVEEKKDEKKTEVQVAPAPVLPTYTVKPRPMVVHGSTYKINTPVGTAFITVNTNENGEPLEVFINVGKAGTDVYAMATALGRVISVALRFSSHLSPSDRVKEIIGQMQDIGGARAMGFGKERIKSLPDAVAKVLNMHFQSAKVVVPVAVPVQTAVAAAATVTNETVKTNGHAKDVVAKAEMAQALMSDESAVSLSSSTEQPSLLTESNEKTLFDICPTCGNATLAHEEGCKKCYSCGYSAC
jgi:ribonucleoside-diphosphate reductase alpha chain